MFFSSFSINPSAQVKRFFNSLFKYNKFSKEISVSFRYNSNLFAERWQRGRMRRTRNPVYGSSVSRVRIPLSPPNIVPCRLKRHGIFVFMLLGVVWISWILRSLSHAHSDLNQTTNLRDVFTFLLSVF